MNDGELSINLYFYNIMVDSHQRGSCEIVQSRANLAKKYVRRLPSYSPNRNPIERLWKWMKERGVYSVYYEGFEEFKMSIMGFFSARNKLSLEFVLGQTFGSRVRDKFRPFKSCATKS
jgi:hypothetical protein